MKEKIIHIFKGLLLLFIMTSAVNAQSNHNGARLVLQNQFGRTQQVIERAEDALIEAQSYRHIELMKIAVLKADSYLQSARNWQNQARNGLNSDATDLEIASSTKMTISAREEAWKALSVIKQASDRVIRMTEENENLVIRQLEKTDDLIERINNQINENVPARLLALFDTARDNQRRAWELYRNQQLRPALKLSRQADKTLQKAVEFFKSDQVEMRRMTDRLNRLEQNLDRSRIIIDECKNGKASDLLKELQSTFDECRKYAEQGNIEGFDRNEKIGEKLHGQINDICRKENDLQPKIKQLNAELDRLTETISGSDNSGALKALESAREYLRKAEKHCAEGKIDACAANLKAAQISMRKAEKLAGS